MDPISSRPFIPDIEIQVGMPRPWTHYFEITVRISGAMPDLLDLVMPVWTPGSYLVREYSRNIQEFSAAAVTGDPLEWSKTDKNTWRIHCEGASGVVVHYRAYAFELSVRASFVDDSHAFIHGASLFMYIDGCLKSPYRLAVVPPPGWKRISTGLEPLPGAPATFLAPDFDTLVDCPVEIGNQAVFEFETCGAPHYLSIYGDGNHDPARLCSDLKKIVETASEIFGEVPYSHYTFLIRLHSEGGGGLEHANSSALLVSRWAFKPDENYRKFLALASHEFFHVWNGKRIRPAELGPFDYRRENYTRLLWVTEGFTDYYGDLILRRAGLATPDQFLEGVSKTIRDLAETPGRMVESAAEASFDAWIKFYRQDEHFPNASVSYYAKGALIALCLDLELRHRWGGSRCLDDIMRLLYTRYFKGLERGFSGVEFLHACEEVTGETLEGLLDEYAGGTDEIDYARFLDYAGLGFAGPAKGQDDDEPKGWLGVNVKNIDGRIVISAIPSGTPGCEQGLSVNDEIIAIDGYRASLESLAARIEEKAPGTAIEVLVARAGKLLSAPIVLGRKKVEEFRIVTLPGASAGQKRLFESWLQAPWKDR